MNPTTTTTGTQKQPNNAWQATEPIYHNNKSENVTLPDVKVICYYAAAKWCHACTKFTPLLIDFYQSINKDSKQLEIVYISCDNIESDYKSSIESFPWLTLPFNHPFGKKFLDDNQITTIPSVLIVRKDGVLVKKDGRADVQLNGVKCFEEWIKSTQ